MKIKISVVNVSHLPVMSYPLLRLGAQYVKSVGHVFVAPERWTEPYPAMTCDVRWSPTKRRWFVLRSWVVGSLGPIKTQIQDRGFKRFRSAIRYARRQVRAAIAKARGGK